MSKGNLIVFSGPSGSGKGTILKAYLDSNNGKNAAISVSATTRAPRHGETHGVNYFFLSKHEFEETIKNDGFLEYAKFCDNYYGTPKSEVQKKLDQGIDVILEIEVQGAMNIKKQIPDAVMIFVIPPSFKELRQRLVNRGTETEDVIDKRIGTALKEVEYINEYTYVIINDKLDEAVSEFDAILKAEKLKVNKNTNTIQEVCKL